MNVLADPNKIEELSQQFKRWRRELESSFIQIGGTANRVAGSARSSYPEDGGVRSAAQSIERLAQELQREASTFVGELDEQSKQLYHAASEYRQLEREAERKLKSSKPFRFPAGISRYVPFISSLEDTRLRQSRLEASLPVIKQMYYILNPASFVRQLMDMLLAKQVAIVNADPLIAKWLRALTEGTLEEKEAARLGLSTVALSLKEIAEAQQEYSVYKLFGQSAYMEQAHLRANEARVKLRDLGIEEQYYKVQVNLAITNSDDPLLACRFNPIKDDGSSMPENEELLSFIHNVLAKGKVDPMDRLQYALLEEKLRKIESGELPPTHLPDGRLIDAYNKENETTFDYFQAHLKNENMQNPYLEYIVWLDDTYGKTEWRKKVETADAVVRGFGTGVIKGVIEGVVDTAGLAYQLVVDPQKVGQDMLYAAEYIIQNPEMVVEAAKQMYTNFESASPEEKAEMIGNVASILIPGVSVTKAGKAAKVPEALNVISHSAKEAIKNVDWRTQFAKPQDWFNGLQSNRYFVTPEGIAIKVPDEPPSSVMKIDAGDGRKTGQGVGSVSKQSVQIIQNRYPNEIQQGKSFEYVLENGQVKIRDGIKEVDFIIDVNGNLKVGRGHSHLANGADVQAAGKLKVDANGNVRRITNESGHYTPTAEQAKNYEQIFNSAGIKTENAWLEIYQLELTSNGYVDLGKLKKVQSTILK